MASSGMVAPDMVLHARQSKCTTPSAGTERKSAHGDYSNRQRPRSRGMKGGCVWL